MYIFATYLCMEHNTHIHIYTRYLKNQGFKNLQIGIEKNHTNKDEDSATNTLMIKITTARVVS